MDTNYLSILSFGAHSDPTNSEAYIARALERLGHQVIRLDERGTSRDKLILTCAEAKPDLLLGAKFRFTGADGFDGPAAKKTVAALAECRPHVGQVCCWVFDALMPAFAQERWEWAETLAPAVDVFACTDGMAAKLLPNSLWLLQGSTDDVDHDADWPTEFEGDVLFCGTAYRERGELMDQLRARFGSRFRIVPDRYNGEAEVHGPALTKLVRSYRINVCPSTPTWPGYFSNRAVVISGHGGLLAMAPVEGMQADGWRPSTNYLALPNAPDLMAAKLSEIIERLDRGQLDAIRRNGYELAKALTYEKRCTELLAHLDAKRQREAPAIAPAATGPIDTDGSLGDEPTEPEGIESSTQSHISTQPSSGSPNDDCAT